MLKTKDILDENIDASSEEKIKALKKLLNKLNVAATPNNGSNPLNKVYSTQADLNRREIQLYNSILFAIA